MGGLIQESSPGGGGSGDAATETTLQSVLVQLLAILTELLQKTEPTDTQPISAVTLPLPTGASTAALQLPDSHNVTVDNAAGATAVNVQDGGNSLTVDGTFFQATQPVSAASLPLPAGAATDATLVIIQDSNQALANATIVDNTGFTDGITRVGLDGFIFDEVVGTALTENDAAAARIDSKRAQITVIEDATTRGLRAAVLNLAGSDPLCVAVLDGAGAQITSFGGGTQYTEADVDATITGTAVMWEDASDTLRAVSVTKPLPVGTKTDLTPSAPTFATVGVASAQAVAAAATRKGLILVNTSGNTISLGFGSAAVLNSGVTLLAGMAFSMDEYSFDLGAVNAIASAASSNLSIQEYLT